MRACCSGLGRKLGDATPIRPEASQPRPRWAFPPPWLTSPANFPLFLSRPLSPFSSALLAPTAGVFPARLCLYPDVLATGPRFEIKPAGEAQPAGLPPAAVYKAQPVVSGALPAAALSAAAFATALVALALPFL